jgi:hypothetical protein
MEKNETGSVNYRNLALPLCLISLIFFSFYIVIIDWIFSGQIRSFLNLIFPAPIAESFFQSHLTLEIIICILSLIGALQLVRELKKQSFAWKIAGPLCVAIGAILVSAVLIPLISIVNFQQFLGYVIFTGLAFLPFCTDYLFSGLKIRADPDSILSASPVIGYFGLILAVLLIFSALTYVPPPKSPENDHMWDLGPPHILIEVVLALIYAAAALPYLGSKILGLGLEYQVSAREKFDPI